MAKLPKGIRARGDSYFVDVSWQGCRKTGTVPMSQGLDAAIALRARLDADLKTTSVQPSSTPTAPERGGAWTLGIAFDRTVEARWRGQKSCETAELNAGIAVDYFGRTRKLDTIDTDAIDGFVALLIRKGNADGTINRKLAALSTILRTAHDRGKLATLPKMPRRKESQGRIRFLIEDEETNALRILRQWDKLDEVDAFEVLIDTGVRFGELMRIDGTRDVSMAGKSPILSVWETKGDLPRSIPLTTRAAGVIQRRAITHKGKIFPYHDQWMRHTWDRMKDTMGLIEDEQFVIHALRHTFASRLVQRGVAIQVVQQLLGHKDIKMTMRYAHLSPSNLTAAIAVLEPAKVTA